MSFARLERVTVAYGQKLALQDCSLEFKERAITCLIGLSGAGKSTILKLLDGLRRPTSGHVYVKDVDMCCIPYRELVSMRLRIGYAFQFAALFDSLSVYENLALPLREHTELTEKEIEQKVNSVLDLVGLAETHSLMPAELSGGMVKRVGFARAIVTDPELVLYDEPTTGVDPIINTVLTQTIKRVQKRLGGTAVVVSHDLESIYSMADYIAMLFEGRIVAYGTVEEVRNSSNPAVQQFLHGRETGPIHVR